MKLKLLTSTVFLCSIFTMNIARAQCPVTAVPAISMHSICKGDSLRIQDLSSGVDVLQHSYHWDFNNDGVVDDSTTMGNISFLPASGKQVVTLTIKDTAGCASSVSDSAWVSVPAQAKIVITNLFACLGETVVVNNQTVTTGAGYTFYWDFNRDGSIEDSVTTANQNWVPTGAGKHFIALTVTDSLGCSSKSSDSITMVAKAQPQFTTNAICAGDTLVVTDASTGVTSSHNYKWDINEDGLTDVSTRGSFKFVPAQQDTFQIALTLVDQFGCSATTTHNVVVWPVPIANYTASSACLGTASVFTDNSTQTGNNPIYAWNILGDEQIDTAITSTFNYTYAAAGTYLTSLQITNQWGCFDRDSHEVMIGSYPVAKFGPTLATVCATTPLPCIDSSSNTTPTTSYLWDINNDGTVDNTHPGNTSLYYGTMLAASYTIKLKVVNPVGCADSTYRSVNITPSTISVNAGSDKTIICSGSTQLAAVSSRTTGVTYSWYPMNVSNPTIANPTAAPDVTTFYVATATYAGCSAVDSVKVEVTPVQVSAGIDQAIVCGNAVSLTSSSNITSGLLYSWYPTTGLSNPAAATVQASPHTSTNYVLTVTKGNCTASDTVAVSVTPIQVSAGSDKNITCGSTVALTTSVNSTAVVYEWWPTQDLSSFTTASPVASPTDTLMYIVKASKNGCEARDTVVVNVTPYEVFAGSDKTITCGTTTMFATSVSGVTGQQYNWTPAFGLSNPFISNPTATVTVDTTYVVTVTKGLCLSRDTISVFVNNKLPIAFTANKTTTNTRPYAIKFTNQTTNAANYNFTWLFEDGGSSNQPSPSYTFPNPGQYGVQLVAQSLNGACLDTLKMPGYITCLVATGLNDEVSEKADVWVYPNPTQGSFSVKLNAKMSGGSLSIFNITGQQVFSKQLGTTHDEEVLVVDEIKSTGMYLLLIQSETGVWSGKVLVR